MIGPILGWTFKDRKHCYKCSVCLACCQWIRLTFDSVSVYHVGEIPDRLRGLLTPLLALGLVSRQVGQRGGVDGRKDSRSLLLHVLLLQLFAMLAGGEVPLVLTVGLLIHHLCDGFARVGIVEVRVVDLRFGKVQAYLIDASLVHVRWAD